ncbi:MAG TPA: hypothetical protein VF781_06235 [Solirubrobacteraceae bacterium]
MGAAGGLLLGRRTYEMFAPAWSISSTCSSTLGMCMKVEVLYFDGCPSHEALLPRLRELMAEAGVDAPVELTRVDSPQTAEQQRFLGSPTLRINGEDVEPAASERTDFGLKCRLYPSRDGLRGRVPDALVRAALSAAKTEAA